MTRKKKLINRELSWLSFNHRVLQESVSEDVPLIERMRFLGIFSNNLDEFFKVRVATIKRMIDIQYGHKRVEGIKPQQLMLRIQKKVLELQNQFDIAYNEIVHQLEKKNIFIVNEKELDPGQETYVKDYFNDKVRPVISPIMLHNICDFPFMKDRSIYLAIKLTNSLDESKTEYALMEVPTDELPRFTELPCDGDKKFIILLEDIIRLSLQDIFSTFNFDTYEAWIVKLTRDAELDMDNDVSQSFLETISKGVSGRKSGQPVRFIFDGSIAEDLLDFVVKRIGLDEDNNLIAGGRCHNFKDFISFPYVGGEDLVYEKLPPLPHPLVTSGDSILAVMRKRDFMLHVPFQDFNVFISLLQEVSMDPLVEEISITIYRVARNSKVMNALINACRNGKKVNIVIELQARFDEESNIYWSRKLEEEGANIYFGIPNLKVHAKLVCISRKEEGKIMNYSCVSTGNFHEGNASVYSDLILFTCDKRITNDVKHVFEFFEHTYRNQNYRHIIASPLYMRRRFYRLIDQEINNAKEGKDAYVVLKINNLVDKDIINKLYEANAGGVKITLNIRGVCSLIPGVKGLSENIEAISIVDRFLEHSRIMVFCNDGNEKFYISSADWMTRNLDRRIEVACPIYDEAIRDEMRDIINIQKIDNIKARIIDEEQNNVFVKNDTEKAIRSQYALYKYYQNKLK